MGLFDKKYCDFCGNKIGLLGNKKLEDGNMCKDCASKLSPWFSERRHSTKASIAEQLSYREENAKAAAAFHTTRSIGKYIKLLMDEDNQKFVVTSAKDLAAANPDVLDFSQATGCTLDISESRNELKTKDKDGKSVSYNPPRYEYSYNFHVTISVDHPYFDEMKYSLSNGYIRTGEQQMTGTPGGWNVHRNAGFTNLKLAEYYEYLNLGNEIKEAVTRMHMIARGEAVPAPSGAQQDADTGQMQNAAPVSAEAPSAAPVHAAAPGKVTCPYCGADTTPDAAGKCEYCGSPIA